MGSLDRLAAVSSVALSALACDSGGSGGAGGGSATSSSTGDVYDVGIVSAKPGADTTETESQIAITDTGQAVVAWGDVTHHKIGFSLSTDGGTTWSEPKTAVFATNGEPMAAADDVGTLYMGGIGAPCTDPTCQQNAIWLTRKGPSGATFKFPVDMAQGAFGVSDRPWAARLSHSSVGVAFGIRQGTYPQNLDEVGFGVLHNDGSSEFATVGLATMPGVLFASPHVCATRDSEGVWVLYSDSSNSVGGRLRWSHDSGLTWAPEDQSIAFSDPALGGELQAYELRCVASGLGEIWILLAFADGQPTAEGYPPIKRLAVVHSTDSGVTFEPPVDVPLVGFALHPELVMALDGTIYVSAYIGDGPSDVAGRFGLYMSFDHGGSFKGPLLIHKPILFGGSANGAASLGNKSGLTTDATNVYVSYSDNASGTSHVAVARIPRIFP